MECGSETLRLGGHIMVCFITIGQILIPGTLFTSLGSGWQYRFFSSYFCQWSFTLKRLSPLCVRQDETITAVTSVIGILYYANLLGAAEREPPDCWDTTDPPLVGPDTDADNFASVMVLANSAR
jgi:hypothetical protein